MPEQIPPDNSLVLYKMRPARVQRIGDKLALEMEGGETIRVRPKDVVLLHPGPLRSLAELRPPRGDVQTAWEILAGSTTTLPELAELAFGAYTPASAWAAWQTVAEGLYFRGTPGEVIACRPEEVAQAQAARAARAAEEQAWEAFLGRARAGHPAPEDDQYLREVESLALGQSTRSRVLRALGREETPENAHETLLELGYWDDTVNPHPPRLDVALAPPSMELIGGWPVWADGLPPEERADLTRLPAFAIDDAFTETPDDALSLDPPGPGDPGWGRLWVHVADPAALVQPGDPVDLEARARGATLHLPEEVVPMLPASATPLFGLGLAEVSPALSFGLDLDAEGRAIELEIVPSWVRVTRLTYEEAEARLDEEPFHALYRIAEGYAARRKADGAVEIELPEASVRVRDGEISIQPVLPLRSRLMVENAMIMAGEAVAGFGVERDIPLPYATQEAPDVGEPAAGNTLAAMYALRRTLRRSQYRGVPAPHSGLGLGAYVQVTSPLRRYLDLVAHQQIRAYLSTRTQAPRAVLGAAEILERVGAVEAVMGTLRQAEQLSNRHWTLVYLLRHAGWRGRAVLVEKRGSSGTFLIPELALETQVHLPADLPLDSQVTLRLRSVDLPRLDARFRVEEIQQPG